MTPVTWWRRLLAWLDAPNEERVNPLLRYWIHVTMVEAAAADDREDAERDAEDEPDDEAYDEQSGGDWCPAG